MNKARNYEKLGSEKIVSQKKWNMMTELISRQFKFIYSRGFD